MRPLVTSFFSDPPGRPVYATVVRELAADLRRHGVPFDVRSLPFPGSWREACLAKPRFLLDQLDRHRRPLIWIDADSRVLRPLPDLDPTFDVAAPEGSGHDTGLVVLTHEVAVLAVGDTPGARRFLEAWAAACAAPGEVADHTHFLRTWHAAGDDVRRRTLPASWCRRQPTPDTIVHLRKVAFADKAREAAALLAVHRRGGA